MNKKLSIILFIVFAVNFILPVHLYLHKHPYFFKRVYKLYPFGAPDSNGLYKTDEENFKIYGVMNNSEAKYYIFRAKKNPTGKAVILLPGGGYGQLMYGTCLDAAKYFSENGITSIVLLYRMPNKKYHNIPLEDAQNMIKLVRKNTNNLNINKIGVMGYSAGGHLAAVSSVHFDTETKPDFAILYYPVISMKKDYTHTGSKYFLFGEVDKNYKELEDYYSAELNVKSNTPQTYVVHCEDDEIAAIQNSKDYINALNEKNIPNKFTVYQNCGFKGHGWDWESKNFPYKEQDRENLVKWIKSI